MRALSSKPGTSTCISFCGSAQSLKQCCTQQERHQVKWLPSDAIRLGTCSTSVACQHTALIYSTILSIEIH